MNYLLVQDESYHDPGLCVISDLFNYVRFLLIPVKRDSQGKNCTELRAAAETRVSLQILLAEELDAVGSIPSAGSFCTERVMEYPSLNFRRHVLAVSDPNLDIFLIQAGLKTYYIAWFRSFFGVFYKVKQYSP